MAKPARKQLTKEQWLTVFRWLDDNPKKDGSPNQSGAVAHFASLAGERQLIFSQPTLFRQYSKRDDIEAAVALDPTLLHMKRPRIVRHPDIEEALADWCKQKTTLGQVVTGPMLTSKLGRLQAEAGISDEDHIGGSNGWLDRFKRAHGLRTITAHGEAASAPVLQVPAERERVAKLLAKFHPDDRYNADETALFPHTPPARGLALEQIAGQKVTKFRVTALVCCNQSGTDKRPLLFIGKSKCPRVFNKRAPPPPIRYTNSQKAWMTKNIYEEEIKRWDRQLQKEGRKIILLHDNFSGHQIDYEPECITIENFSPNLTAWVQPCDAGIIRTLKARYRRLYCERALDLDELDENDIWSIDLLSALRLLCQAWEAVTPQTIHACWKHTGILPEFPHRASAPVTVSKKKRADIPPLKDPQAWDILLAFAHAKEGLVDQVQKDLARVLGSRYREEDWMTYIFKVQSAEDDEAEQAAIAELKGLAKKAVGEDSAAEPEPAVASSDVAGADDTPSTVTTPQLRDSEQGLHEAITELKHRRRIIGAALSLEEMINPDSLVAREQDQIGQADFWFGGHEEPTDAELLERARQSLAYDENPDAGNSDADEPATSGVSFSQAAEHAAALRKFLTAEGADLDTVGLERHLRRLQIELRRREVGSAKQTTLQAWFTPIDPQSRKRGPEELVIVDPDSESDTSE